MRVRDAVVAEAEVGDGGERAGRVGAVVSERKDDVAVAASHRAAVARPHPAPLSALRDSLPVAEATSMANAAANQEAEQDEQGQRTCRNSDMPHFDVLKQVLAASALARAQQPSVARVRRVAR